MPWTATPNSYELSAWENWIASCNEEGRPLTSPLTNLEVDEDVNRALRSAIETWRRGGFSKQDQKASDLQHKVRDLESDLKDRNRYISSLMQAERDQSMLINQQEKLEW